MHLPPFVFHLQIHNDAVINELGDAFCGSSALLLCARRRPHTENQLFIPADAASSALYLRDEIPTVTQFSDAAVFHRTVEFAPRIVPRVEFLKDHLKIRIHALESGPT